MNTNKNILLLIVCLFFLTCPKFYAQSIAHDAIGENGIRFIFAEDESIRSFSDKNPMWVHLNAGFSRDGSKVFLLVIKINGSIPIEIPKSGRLLIKLMDDENIELSTKSGDLDYDGIQVGSAGKYYSVSPSYSITEEQIHKIFNGVKKIRIESITNNIDKEFKKDKIGQIIKGHYNLILETYNSSESPNDDSFKVDF